MNKKEALDCITDSRHALEFALRFPKDRLLVLPRITDSDDILKYKEFYPNDPIPNKGEKE